MSINEASTSTSINNDAQSQHEAYTIEENSNAFQVKANDHAEVVASTTVLVENQLNDNMHTRKRSRSIVSSVCSEKSRQSSGNDSQDPGPSLWLNTSEETSNNDYVDASDTERLIEESRSCNKDVSADFQVKLKKSMTLMDGVGIIVGVMIGSGIFVSPKGVLQYSGSVGLSLSVWGISGIFVLIGAICYAELGTMIPLSGGDYIYIGEAFGPLPAFLYLWVSLLIIQPVGNAVIALAFANYIIYPWFNACIPAAPIPDISIKLIAAVLTCFLTWVNCVSTRASLKMQDFLTLAKVGALIMIIGAGIYHLATGNTQNFQNPFAETDLEAGSIATAFYQGLFSFAGWNCLNFVTEELQDPYKNLPRAIMISIPLVLIIYFFTNVAYFAVLTPAEILAADAVAVNFGERVLGVMHWTIPFFVACATFSSLNGCIFSGSRILYSSAREGHLPDVLGLISIRHFTPIPSLVILMVVTLAYMVTSDIQLLINYVTFSESLFITASIAALIWLRIKQPNRHRPIKVWIIFPIIFFIVCLFLVIFPVIKNPVELGIASAVILSGVPVYYLCFRPSPCCRGITERFTRVCQLLVEGLPEEDEINSETIDTNG
ncbi:unnamed protein product [Meganyctiphanes norvegica]|uniref:Y+L amino acid transporter 2 n=1 Tax=Meganyctiphanes norvegica TaxID=48144 RepID=A0AAV2QJK3_MEGNR